MTPLARLLQLCSCVAIAATTWTACAATQTPATPFPAAAPNSLLLRVVPAKTLHLGSLLTARGLELQLSAHIVVENRGKTPQIIDEVRIERYRRGALLGDERLRCPALAKRLAGLPWIRIRDRQSLAAAHRYRRRFRRSQGHCRVAADDAVSLLSWGRRDKVALAPDELRIHARSLEGGRASLRVPVLRYVQRTRLRLPFAGPWVALAGHRDGEPHASHHLSSQRFAYDLVMVGADGSTLRGGKDSRPDSNASYLAYGQPVLAAASGVVVRLSDGVADNRPGRRPSWRSLLRRPEDLAGNFVVLRHQHGEHSAYFHLQRGLELKLGQEVSAGQVLGRCGNSGNSAEPHIHFQLQAGPDPLRARGLPALFSDFAWRYGQVQAYVGPTTRAPLPERLTLLPGRPPRAIDASRLLR